MGCESCLVLDDTGRILWARSPELELPNASTTKMVTALVAARADDGGLVRISRSAAATGGGGPQLRAGARFTVPQLLGALLMASSNDAAVALAEHVGGSEAGFVEMMNDAARRLGASGTNFVNAHGLDAPGHYSTARDLALFGQALLDTPVLAEIVRRRAIVVPTQDGRQRFENTNLLLDRYPGGIGIKTGYTLGAGNVLVGAAEREGRTLVSVVMQSEDAFADTETLLDLGWRKLARQVLLRAGARIASVVFDPGGATTAVAAREVRGPSLRSDVTVSFEVSEVLSAPEAGQRVGVITVTENGATVASVPAVADRAVESDDGDSLASRVLGTILRFGSAVVPVHP